jgi:hypothetical protein
MPSVWYMEVPTPMPRNDTKKITAGAEEKSPSEHSSWYLRSLLHRKASDRSKTQREATPVTPYDDTSRLISHFHLLVHGERGIYILRHTISTSLSHLSTF